jgi:hypothetical protein
MATVVLMPAVVADAETPTDGLVGRRGDQDTKGKNSPRSRPTSERRSRAETAGSVGRLLGSPGERIAVGAPIAVLLAAVRMPRRSPRRSARKRPPPRRLATIPRSPRSAGPANGSSPLRWPAGSPPNTVWTSRRFLDADPAAGWYAPMSRLSSRLRRRLRLPPRT